VSTIEGNLPFPQHDTTVALAMAVPAVGEEADDWRARNLAESLLHALLTQQPGALAAIDDAASTLPAASPRFATRLRTLRGLFGPVPARYPSPRTTSTDLPWPPPHVRRHAIAFAHLADHAHTPSPTGPPPTPSGAAEVAADLDRTAYLRPFGHTGHHCVDVCISADLVWREWLMNGHTPMLAVAFKPPSPNETAQRPALQLHNGTHMDHLAELAEHSGPSAARKLQFGSGLVVAESVAMTVEITTLADATQDVPLRASLHHMLIDRLSRLPGLVRWGLAELPGSPSMHQAAAVTHGEFAALPTLACTYIAGPFRLAARDFEHPLIPPRLRAALRARWATTMVLHQSAAPSPYSTS
jgi:hypothetical protein